ncbi:MAG: hypothetical protein QOK90_10685 [Nitrososphaeraceae archaeon]|nr:hypothetical protein [Nitrososphaeraceae archaeon]
MDSTTKMNESTQDLKIINTPSKYQIFFKNKMLITIIKTLNLNRDLQKIILDKVINSTEDFWPYESDTDQN